MISFAFFYFRWKSTKGYIFQAGHLNYILWCFEFESVYNCWIILVILLIEILFLDLVIVKNANSFIHPNFYFYCISLWSLYRSILHHFCISSLIVLVPWTIKVAPSFQVFGILSSPNCQLQKSEICIYSSIYIFITFHPSILQNYRDIGSFNGNGN